MASPLIIKLSDYRRDRSTRAQVSWKDRGTLKQHSLGLGFTQTGAMRFNSGEGQTILPGFPAYFAKRGAVSFRIENDDDPQSQPAYRQIENMLEAVILRDPAADGWRHATAENLTRAKHEPNGRGWRIRTLRL